MIKIRVDTRGIARLIGKMKEGTKDMAKSAIDDTINNLRKISKEVICATYELDPHILNMSNYYDEDVDIDDLTATITISGEEIPLEEGFYLEGPPQTDAGDSVFYRIRRGITEKFPKFGFIGHGTAYKRKFKEKPAYSNPFYKYGTPTAPDMIGNQSTQFLGTLAMEFEKNIQANMGKI